ncbi:MAG: hypothetical protein K9L28_07180 [Synergistales bacterium]|nr:hypothetical protein [Synergistales bacterium]
MNQDLREQLQRIRHFLTSTPEARRLALILLAVLVAFVAGSSFMGRAEDAAARVELQERRFDRLVQVVEQYKNQQGGAADNGAAGEIDDPLGTVSAILEEVGVKSAVQQLSSTRRGISLELQGLYGDGVLGLLRGVRDRGFLVAGLTLRSTRTEGERLYMMQMLLEVRQ